MILSNGLILNNRNLKMTELLLGSNSVEPYLKSNKKQEEGENSHVKSYFSRSPNRQRRT
jgi:hypothetical protein